MLTKLEVESLMELMMTGGEVTMDTLYQQFVKKFSNESRNLFRPCWLCLSLIQENLITEEQRITCIYLIMETYRVDQKANPFIPNLIDALLQSADQFEAKLFSQLFALQNKDRDIYGKMELQALLLDKDKHTYINSTIYEDKLKEIKQKYLDRVPKNLLAYNYGLTNILCDFNLTQDLQNYPPTTSISADGLNLCDLEIMSFLPDTLRPIPESEPLGLDEEEWLNPGIIVEPLWDYKICEASDAKTLLQEILIKAYETKLNESENDVFRKELEQEEMNVDEIEVNVELLQKLVENNNKIASQLLIKIAKEKDLTQYLEKISSLDLTLQSLEVVNDLINNVQLPKEFIDIYVSNIIQQCEDTKKSTHQRLVRLVCVFIRQLIKSKNINPKDNFIELQAFSIENFKISEAHALFKQLKEVDNDTHSNHNNNNNNSAGT